MAEARRRALIGAALKEISDRGSLDVTVAQIASRAGVSSALAHHYFGGKDDLILATMRHLLAEFGAGVVDAAARPPTARGPGSPRSSAAASARSSSTSATISAWLTFYAWALSSRAGGAAPAHLPASAALEPRPRAALPRRRAPRPPASPRGSARLIDGVYLREALRGRPTAPEAAIAAIEAYLDRELGRTGSGADDRPARRLALDRRRPVRGRRRPRRSRSAIPPPAR